MYWYVSGKKTRTCVIPYYVPGELQDFTAQLVIEDGEFFRSAYLTLIDTHFIGVVQCRIEPSDRWIDIGGIYDSTCFLGTLTGPAEVSIELRIAFPTDFGAGEYVVPIQLFHGEGLPGGPDYTFSGADDEESPLWGEEESDAPLWNSAEGDAPFWESGSMCGRKEYLYLPPGEELSKWDAVRVETDGTVAAYQTAGCVDTESSQTSETIAVERVWMRAYANATLAEANCLGIIDDDCVNYVHALDGVVASDGGYSVYWQGGSIEGTPTDRVWRLNRITRLWEELASGVIAGRVYHVGWWYDGKLYIWGGQFGSSNFLNSLYRFDPADSSWTALTSGGTARCLAAVMIIDDTVHIVGGVDATGNVVQTVDNYSLTNDSWSTGTEAPMAFASLSISISPLARPVWQVCEGTLFYGGPTAGRDELFWTYNGSAWSAPATLADTATPGRGVLPNVPLKPTYSLPQHCVRLQPYGTDGMAEWIGIPTEDKRMADVYNEDVGFWGSIDIGERRALLQGFCTDASWELTIGQQQWLGATEGSRTTTRPAAGWIQVLGEAASTTTFCFHPQNPSYLIVLWANSSWIYDGVRYGYNFGGDDGTGVTGRLRRLDYLTMQWEELATSSIPRTNAGMTYSAGYLYVVGGKDGDGNVLDSMSIYNAWTDTWDDSIATTVSAAYDQVVMYGAWPDGGYWAGEWTSGYCYQTDAVVYHDGVYYQALQTHLAVASSEPDVGDDWEDYWVAITELPDIYIIDGIGEDGAANGDVWVYDPNEGTLSEGLGAGSDFTDSFNTTTSDFTTAIQSTLGLNSDEDNEWACDIGSQMVLVGLGSYIYLLGIKSWMEGGEIAYFQRILVPYNLATDTWGTSIALTGDYAYAENIQDLIGTFTYAIGYGHYIYLFGHAEHNGSMAFIALRISVDSDAIDIVSTCRSGSYEVNTNDRVGCTATYYDGKMYFYGGHGDMSILIDVFDFETATFTTGVTAVGIERWDHNATIADGILYLFYGQNSDGVINTCNQIDLDSLEYSVWTVREDAPSAANTLSSCSDDDGNLYVGVWCMFSPSEDTWVINEETFTGQVLTNLAYYGGALYWAECEDLNLRMYKIDLGASYVPVAVTKTVKQNLDGSFTVTWSTGETYITLSLVTLSSTSRTPSVQWTNAYSAATHMTTLSGSSSGSKQTTTIQTGWSTSDGGQQSVQYSWTFAQTTSGSQCVGSQIIYANND